jgi:hypothetical protein
MDVARLADAAGLQGQTEGATQRRAAQRLGGGGRTLAAMAFGREQLSAMAMGLPLLEQVNQGALRQRHVTIAISLASTDVEESQVADLRAGLQGQQAQVVSEAV